MQMPYLQLPDSYKPMKVDLNKQKAKLVLLLVPYRLSVRQNHSSRRYRSLPHMAGENVRENISLQAVSDLLYSCEAFSELESLTVAV